MNPGDPPTSGPARAEHDRVGGLAVTRRRVDGAEVSVLLVHGAMDRSASFGRVMRRLAVARPGPDSSALDVVAHDRRGYAGSLDAGPAAGPGLSAHVADVHAIAGWSGSGEVVLVGHSLGGLICVLAAAAWPARAPRLRAVLAFELPRGGAVASGDTPGGRALAAARASGAPAAAESFMREMVGDASWERLRASERDARRAEGATLVEELLAMRTVGALPGPGVIGAPVTVGRGSATGEPIRSTVAATAAELGVAPEELPGAGHGAHLSHPDLFAAWIRGHVEGPAGPHPTPVGPPVA